MHQRHLRPKVPCRTIAPGARKQHGKAVLCHSSQVTFFCNQVWRVARRAQPGCRRCATRLRADRRHAAVASLFAFQIDSTTHLHTMRPASPISSRSLNPEASGPRVVQETLPRDLGPELTAKTEACPPAPLLLRVFLLPSNCLRVSRVRGGTGAFTSVLILPMRARAVRGMR